MCLILVVDDNAAARGTAARTLSDAGHLVVTAPGPVIAEAMLRRGGIDLVITDLLMPEGDGISLIQATKKKWPGMPIIATDDGGRTKRFELLDIAKRYGADAVVRKPFEAPVLMRSLNMLLDSKPMPFGGFN